MKNKRIILLIIIAALIILSACIGAVLFRKNDGGNKAEDPPKQSQAETTTASSDAPKALNLTKESIPKTDDWRTSGLESAGITGVEVKDPYKATFGYLYVLKHYNVSGVYHDTFFAIETEKTVYLQKISELTAVSAVFICDVDGETGDEIVIREYSGNAVETTTAFSVDDGKAVKIFSTTGEGAARFDTGFSFELCAPFRVVIKNAFTGYETEHDFSDMKEKYESIYDSEGVPAENKKVWLWYTTVFPKDVDGDGIYELVAEQNTCLLSNAENFGKCVAVLKYDKALQSFAVIDAEFIVPEETVIKEGEHYKITYESFLYTYYVYGKDGNVLWSDTTNREVDIAQLTENTVEVCVQTGTGLSTNWAIFFDVETGKRSETFQYVLGAEGDCVIFGDYDSKTDEWSLIVQNIFDSSKYYKRYVLENASNLAADFSGIEKLGDGDWEITYLTGEDYKQETLTISLPH